MSINKINLFEQVQGYYSGTKAAVEALTGIIEGSIGYATDTDQFGSYNGSVWTWGQGGGIPNPFALTADITPTALSASQNDYNPTGLSTADILRLSTTSGNDYNITGLSGGADGRIIVIHNIGTTGTITLKDESASSSAANRFSLSRDILLAPEESITLQYDATSSRWRPLSVSLMFDDVGGDPSDVGTTASDGTSVYPARRDHVHKGGVWELISDQVAGAGGLASFDFTSIPPAYKHLKILLSARSDRSAISDGVKMKINNDTGNNYVGRIQWVGGSSEQLTAGAPVNVAWTTGATSPSNWFSNAEFTLFDHSNTGTYKTVQGRGGDLETNSAGNSYIYDAMMEWLSTSAITRVTIYPNIGTGYVQYSRCSLYGIKA